MGSDRDMSPQNMPLWHEDYFELKVLEKEQMQGKLFTAPNCLKIKVKNFPFVKEISMCKSFLLLRKKLFSSLDYYLCDKTTLIHHPFHPLTFP